jgi:hypothetical protein
MTHKPQRSLAERVVEAAEGALAEQGYVSAIDVFTRMGLLALAHVDDWRRGRLPYLEPAIQGSFEKVSRTKMWAPV